MTPADPTRIPPCPAPVPERDTGTVTGIHCGGKCHPFLCGKPGRMGSIDSAGLRKKWGGKNWWHLPRSAFPGRV
jgi:hypothetical protein